MPSLTSRKAAEPPGNLVSAGNLAARGRLAVPVRPGITVQLVPVVILEDVAETAVRGAPAEEAETATSAAMEATAAGVRPER